MFKEGDILKSWRCIDDAVIRSITKKLSEYEYDLLNNLIYYVAAICNVDPIDMLSVNDKVHISQCRWLLWYAHRYMTHDSYEKISEKTSIEGHRFKTRSIAAGIEKMSKMIAEDKNWEKKWNIIRHIIRLWKNDDLTKEKKNQVIIIAPNNIEIKIKTKNE